VTADLPAEYPTAVHAADGKHETLKRLAPTAPVGFGVGWIDQAFPFHASARVPVGPSPTAVQFVVEVHEASESIPKLTDGVDWMVQTLPFQDSTIGASRAPVESRPTAKHSVAEAHETPPNWLLAWAG
jgi:hypothetical protein